MRYLLKEISKVLAIGLTVAAAFYIGTGIYSLVNALSTLNEQIQQLDKDTRKLAETIFIKGQ